VPYGREGPSGGIIDEKSMDSADLSTSRLLTTHGFRHAFFTRRGGVSSGPYASLNFSVSVGDSKTNVSENIARAAAALEVDATRIYFLSQVHGAVAVTLRGDEDRDDVVEREGDALVGTDGRAAVAVRIADCVPILVGDAASGAAVAIHAGWRGLAGGVVEAGIGELSKAGGNPADMVAAIGPHIGAAAFEVSEDVAGTLRDHSPDPDVIDRNWGPRPHVDLARIATAKLERLGVPRARIERVGGCTFSEPEMYFSFRRDGPKSGRHLAAIVPRLPTSTRA